jgi:hypothetical protein
MFLIKKDKRWEQLWLSGSLCNEKINEKLKDPRFAPKPLGNKNIYAALAAWRSGHRISLNNRRPGFESRQVLRFSGKHSNAVVKI